MSLGELLAYLTANRSRTILAHHLCQLNQCLHEAIRTFVDNLRACLSSNFAKPCLASLLLWQETFEAELLVRQAALDKSWNEGCGSRQTFHLDSESDTFAHQHKARVTDARGASVTYQCDIQTRGYLFGHLCRRLVLIELVVALHRDVNVVMLHQDTRCTRVLCQDKVGLLKHIHSPEGHILQIADRRWNNIELCHSSIFITGARVGSKVNSFS